MSEYGSSDPCNIDINTPIKLDTVRIMIDSNIPGKDTFELKRQMIFHPTLKASSFKKMSDYPFITKDRCYQPVVTRFLNTQTYDKKISFFFSKERQLKVFEDLNLYNSSGKTPIINNSAKKTNDSEEDSDDNTQLNEEIKEIKEIKEEIKKIKEEIKENKKGIDILEKSKRDAIRNLDDVTFDYYKSSINHKMRDLLNQPENFEFKNITLKNPDNDDKLLTQINNLLRAINKANNQIIYNLKQNKELKQLIVDLHNTINLVSENSISVKINRDVNKIYIKNVKTMLGMLFPNSFPALNNIKDSYSMLINPNESDDSVFSWKNVYPRYLFQPIYPDQYYSYLQIDGKTYTTTQLVWLNDIFNHPKYKELIDKYEFFIVWKEQQKTTLKTDLSKKQQLFNTDFNTGKYRFSDSDKQFFIDKKYDLSSIASSDRSYSEKLDLNRNLDGIHDNIEDIEDSLSKNKTSDVYKEILDSALAIRTLYKKVSDKIIVKKDIENKVTRLISSITEINAIINIQQKFIDTNEIVLNYESEDKSTVDELKEKYPEYIEFVDLFKTFIRPKRNTTNVELQNTIEDFATGSQAEFDALIQQSEDTAIKVKQCTELNILQAKPNEPRFEIYIQLNLIAGKLNDANQSRINCMYKSEYLATELDHILHPSKKTWELPTKRLFFDLDELEKKGALPPVIESTKPPPIETNMAPPANMAPPVAAAAGGSKTRHRILPIYPLRKTRKRRSRGGRSV